jgi:hypothetical protein
MEASEPTPAVVDPSIHLRCSGEVHSRRSSRSGSQGSRAPEPPKLKTSRAITEAPSQLVAGTHDQRSPALASVLAMPVPIRRRRRRPPRAKEADQGGTSAL